MHSAKIFSLTLVVLCARSVAVPLEGTGLGKHELSVAVRGSGEKWKRDRKVSVQPWKRDENEPGEPWKRDEDEPGRIR